MFGLREKKFPIRLARPCCRAQTQECWTVSTAGSSCARGSVIVTGGVIAQACRARAASCSPSSSIDFSRISTFRIFPVTVIGNSSVTCT